MNHLSAVEKGIYRHNKTGNLYEVIGVALHTETKEILVTYKPQNTSEYEIYVRPVEMFTELVDISGKKVPRFEKILENLAKHAGVHAPIDA